MMTSESFASRMKSASRKHRALNGKLVNAKLALTLTSDEVWAEGLLVFYEIFKFLEQSMRDRRDENLGMLFINGLERTTAFERDLDHYFGGNWKMSPKSQEAVSKYLEHMQHLLVMDSDMLIPYVYYMYMGLLSGAQIMKRKRGLESIFMFHSEMPYAGEAIIHFSPFRISELKSQFKETINMIGENLSEEKKSRLIREGDKVFEYNNAVLKTIMNAERVTAEKAVIFSVGIAALFGVYCLFSR